LGCDGIDIDIEREETPVIARADTYLWVYRCIIFDEYAKVLRVPEKPSDGKCAMKRCLRY